MPRYPALQGLPAPAQHWFWVSLWGLSWAVWHCPGWRMVAQDILPSLDSGSLAEKVLNWIWSLPLYNRKIWRRLSRMKLQFCKVSKYFARLAWRWNIGCHHFCKHPLLLPCSSDSSHFSCSLETGCPSVSSTHYLKARDLPPSVSFATGNFCKTLADPYLLNLLPNVSWRLRLLVLVPAREHSLTI